MVFCPNCGAKISEKDKFCPNCNAKLTEQIVEERTQVVLKRSWFSIIMSVIISLISIAIILFLLYYTGLLGTILDIFNY